jgi:hypothetical protein
VDAAIAGIEERNIYSEKAGRLEMAANELQVMFSQHNELTS